MNLRRPLFAFIHGGHHGAWCWTKVRQELDLLGYRSLAMDLPCSDETAGASDYADHVVASLEGITERVVLVAHSLGGLTAPIVAARRPVEHMIFLASVLPWPGRSLADQTENEQVMLPFDGGWARLRDRFYHTCDADDARWALRQLRYQARRPFTEVTPLEAWPDIPRSYVVCGEDRACNPEWSRTAVPKRLGVKPIEMPGSDHSPFLGRPTELTWLLLDITLMGE